MTLSPADKALSESREAIGLQLQQNRRLLAHTLETPDKFPRSFIMQYLIENKAHKGLPIIQLTQSGFMLLRRIAQALYCANRLRRNLKKSH